MQVIYERCAGLDVASSTWVTRLASKPLKTVFSEETRAGGVGGIKLGRLRPVICPELVFLPSLSYAPSNSLLRDSDRSISGRIPRSVEMASDSSMTTLQGTLWRQLSRCIETFGEPVVNPKGAIRNDVSMSRA